jgi:hypothetical protein
MRLHRLQTPTPLPQPEIPEYMHHLDNIALQSEIQQIRVAPFRKPNDTPRETGNGEPGTGWAYSSAYLKSFHYIFCALVAACASNVSLSFALGLPCCKHRSRSASSSAGTRSATSTVSVACTTSTSRSSTLFSLWSCALQSVHRELRLGSPCACLTLTAHTMQPNEHCANTTL